MKEDFLHYVWQYKKFDFSNLKTAQNENLTIINSGFYSQLAGPDFFNAQIQIDSQKWAGNVEIHLKSSDWYVHNHEKDANYDSVILHVVWQHDTPIFRKDNSEIAVLEIQQYVLDKELDNYNKLATSKSWIYCENEIASTDNFVFKNWLERLFFERLERKMLPINQLLLQTGNNWEAVLFAMLAKNFGLNTNGDIFLKIANSIPFAIIRKESFEAENLEALLLGTANLLNDSKQDLYYNEMQQRYNYIKIKHQLTDVFINEVQFFKHRPDNFPTIRLVQLAQLYHQQQNLFSQLITIKSTEECYKLFNVNVSVYWETHYQFDKISPKKRKALSKAFIDLLMINTIIPVQFAYQKSQGKEISEDIMMLLSKIAPEKNAVLDKFALFGVKSLNAFEAQALLQLKNEYCNNKKCLQCAVGLNLLKQ
ncbi:MAG: DUF2851 family protein [Flavobacterium sp.]|nr:DUF2851 family protein [Flavobacterium sp.]